MAKPKFALGSVFSTPGALAAFERSGEQPLLFLLRHALGDWGDLDAEDRLANEDGLRDGSRLLSAYVLKNGARVWAITEAVDEKGNRWCTTLLLPDEY